MWGGAQPGAAEALGELPVWGACALSDRSLALHLSHSSNLRTFLDNSNFLPSVILLGLQSQPEFEKEMRPWLVWLSGLSTGP